VELARKAGEKKVRKQKKGLTDDKSKSKLRASA
jgi:hypothetical protein